MAEEDGMISNEEFSPVTMKHTPVLGEKARRRKIRQIGKALLADPADVTSLSDLAISEGGLLSDSVRQKVWPKLLDLEPYEVSPRPRFVDIQNHKEYTQVLMDVKRCLSRFPPDIPVERRLALQDQLTNLIVRVLIKHPQLCYYQGYHDICVTFLLVVGEELAFALMEKLSATSLRIFMEPTMESTVRILNYLGPILGKFSPNLRRHLEASSVSPVFCLSWLITWFGHVLNNYNQIVRLYDFFLATHDLMPIYLAAAVVLHREEQVLALEPDMAIIHHFLSKVPDDLPFEQLITNALRLFRDYPPHMVEADAARIARTGQGFYHHWISPSGQAASLGGLLVRRLNTAWHHILPSHGSTKRRLLAAATVLLPVAIAIYLYNFPCEKIIRHLAWNS